MWLNNQAARRLVTPLDRTYNTYNVSCRRLLSLIAAKQSGLYRHTVANLSSTRNYDESLSRCAPGMPLAFAHGYARLRV